MFASVEPPSALDGAADAVRMHLYTDMVPHIAWVASSDGAIEYFNRRAFAYTGQELQRYCGDGGGWPALVHPDDAERVRQRWAESVVAEVPFEVDMRIGGADGRFRWHCATAGPVRDAGAVLRWIGTCIDIDERKAMQQRLQRLHDESTDTIEVEVSEARQDHEFRSFVMDNMAEGLYTCDDDGLITSMNRAAANLLGLEQGELVGHSVREIMHARGSVGPPAESAGIVWGGLAPDKERVHAGDSVFVRKDGSSLPVSYSAAPLQLGQRAAGVVVVFRAVSELRMRQQRELENRHDQTLESLGRLSAGLAHEINTPIQFVGDNTRFLAEAYQLMLELLLVYRECISGSSGSLPWQERKERAEAGEEKADIDYLAAEIPVAVKQSMEGIDRVASLVRAMKAFSYKDSNDRGYADLNEAIKTTVIVARNEIKYVADVNLELGELPQVLCHLGDLNQVFLNLLVNSADAMQEKGERGRITITTWAEDSHVVISFADDGCGIPDQVQKTIFEPFFTTKELGKGTGQGLALARTVCEKHGGSIDVRSAAGHGAEFVLRLPVAGTRTEAT
jgi:two-component system NtrC family sensor kinase